MILRNKYASIWNFLPQNIGRDNSKYFLKGISKEKFKSKDRLVILKVIYSSFHKTCFAGVNDNKPLVL